MSRRAIGVCCLIVVLAAGPAAAQGGSAAPTQGAIASVDLLKVMLAHPKYKQAIEQARREAANKTEQLRNKSDQRRSMMQDYDLLRPGSREALNIRKRITIHDKTVEIDYEMIQVEYQHAIVTSLKDVHTICLDAVKELAKERGYAVVMNRATRPVGGLTQFDYMSRLGMRDVLYLKSDLDITDEVMKRLKIEPEKPAEESKKDEPKKDEPKKDAPKKD